MRSRRMSKGEDLEQTGSKGRVASRRSLGVLLAVIRNATLRERGDQMFRDRYRPLISAP
jgi:hypothetical protein